MKKTKFIFLLIAFLLQSYITKPQNTAGTDFWIAIPQNSELYSFISLQISSDYSTSGRVTSSFENFDTIFTTNPGIVSIIPINYTFQFRFTGVYEKAIHITSEKPITVILMNRNEGTTDAFLALPVNLLGKRYVVATYDSIAGNIPLYVTVIPTEDNTHVTFYNKATGDTVHVTLDRGWIYNKSYYRDMTGSTVYADKRIAVIGASMASNVPIGFRPGDYLIEMMPPVSRLGTDFITIPTGGRKWDHDIFRVIAYFDNTLVNINGIPTITLNQGEFYEPDTLGFQTINTSNPVIVMQYAVSTEIYGVWQGEGDPFMSLVPALNQFLDHYTVKADSGYDEQLATIITKYDNALTIKEDGINIPIDSFSVISGTPYYYSRIHLTKGDHIFSGSEPFGLHIYGWAWCESYGKIPGMHIPQNVMDIVLSPDSSNGFLGQTTLCFSAYLKDMDSLPVEGVEVSFLIEGLGNLIITDTSDSAGIARFCYARSFTTPGIDSITASAGNLVSNEVHAWWWNCSDPANAGTIGTPQSNCGKFIPHPLTGNNNAPPNLGLPEYKWQISTIDSINGFADIPDSTSSGLVLGEISKTSWFRRLSKFQCMPDWNDVMKTNTVEIRIDSLLTPSLLISTNHDEICEGLKVVFTAKVVDAGNNPTLEWFVNDVLAQSSDTIVFATDDLLPGQFVKCRVISTLQCSSSDTVTSESILINQAPVPYVQLSDEEFLCLEDHPVLDAGFGFSSYTWQDGSADQMYEVIDSGRYNVIVKDSLNCSSGDTVYIKICSVENHDSGYFYIPDAFTPDGDGLNDVFRVVTNIQPLFFHMAIFERWGELLFETMNINDSWNGRKLTYDAPAGNYIWKIDYQYNNNKPQSKCGHVLLIR